MLLLIVLSGKSDRIRTRDIRQHLNERWVAEIIHPTCNEVRSVQRTSVTHFPNIRFIIQ